MMGTPERSDERDAAIRAMLAHVPFDGWTQLALERALADLGGRPGGAAMLFPGGAGDMVAVYCDLADRMMVADAAPGLAGEASLTRRVRLLVAARLAGQRGNREAVRRALAVLALPRHAGLAAGCLARTVDAIWLAAGDRAADMSWYSKRFILAGVYSATLLFWLHNDNDEAASLEFLDRRLAGVAALGGVGRRLGTVRDFFAGRGNPAAAR